MWFPLLHAFNFCYGLLTRDRTKRLGANGVEEIKHHPFLSNLNWKEIENKSCSSPIQPHFNTVSQEEMNSIPPLSQTPDSFQNHYRFQFSDFFYSS